MPTRAWAYLCPIILLFTGSTAAQASLQEAPFDPPALTGDITLADCLQWVLKYNPALSVYAWEPRLAEARTLQAGLRPNPEVNLEFQDIRFGGGSGGNNGTVSASLTPDRALPVGGQRDKISGSPSGFDASEITLSLSQLIELGGKRMKRVRLARSDERVVDMDYEVLRMEVLSNTARVFVDVLLLQRRLEMATSFTELAEDFYGITLARVQAGKVSPLEATRSNVELQAVYLDTEHARHELEAARIRLAAFWGAATPRFNKVLGDVSHPAKPDNKDAFLEKLEASPDLRRWTAERARREAALSLERALGRPDITVTAGLRSTGIPGDDGSTSFGVSTDAGFTWSRSRGSADDREYSFLLGVSVPIQIFRRNQGRIREAEYALEQLADQERAIRLALQSNVNAEWQTLTATWEEARTLNEQMLPKAQQAFEATQEGYRQGKFGLLDVLLSQRALFEAKKEQLEIYARHYRAKVKMERYTGYSVYVESDVLDPIMGATK